MSLTAKNPFEKKDQQPAQRELEYPVVVHFRLITEPKLFDVGAAEIALTPFEVVAPIQPSSASSGGRYQAYGVSVKAQSRDDLDELDRVLKAVPGVRMVL